MNRHEYKRQNEEREARRKENFFKESQEKKFREESEARLRMESDFNKSWRSYFKFLKWRPVWWKPPSDRFTALVAIFTGLLFAVSGCQLNAIRGQLDAMETDKRPWLRVDVSVSKPIVFSEWSGTKEINVPLTFNLKNYGQAPAINVRVWPSISQHPGISRWKELDGPQKIACEEARTQADENTIGGFAIFPGESNPDARTIGIGNIYQTDDRILFSVFGCVDYTYGDGRHGQTGFRMRLGQVINKRELGLAFIQGTVQPYDEPISPELLAKGYPTTPPKMGYMQPGDVFFRPDEGGNYAK
jgi:hypothetical protein